MKIQINTDKNIEGSQKLTTYLTSLITDGLGRFSDRITRVEVHLSDVNGSKDGEEDKRCMLEARLEGMQPLVVTDQALTSERAVSGAIDKLTSKLDTRIGRKRKY